MVKFLQDEMVNPHESSVSNCWHLRLTEQNTLIIIFSKWFGFFKTNSFTEILPLEESDLYKKVTKFLIFIFNCIILTSNSYLLKDLLGLKTLNEQGKLFRLTVDAKHLDFSQAWFINEIVLKFLKD